MSNKPFADPVREYLSSVGEARLEVQRCKQKLRRLEAQATTTTAHLSAMPRGGGADRNALLATLADVAKEYEDKLIRAEHVQQEVEEFISGINSTTSRCILRLRYADGLEWDQVMRELRKANKYYSLRQVYRLHGVALTEARELYEEIFNHEEKRDS